MGPVRALRRPDDGRHPDLHHLRQRQDQAPMTVSASLPALAAVTDTDCIRATRPLRLGRIPGRYAIGAPAVLRRVLYTWFLPKGILSYDVSFGEGLGLFEGTTLGPRQLLTLRRRLEVSAGLEDYVA